VHFGIIILKFYLQSNEGKVRVIMVFLAIDSDTDIKMSSFHQSRKLIPMQSVISNSRRFHRYSRQVLSA